MVNMPWGGAFVCSNPGKSGAMTRDRLTIARVEPPQNLDELRRGHPDRPQRRRCLRSGRSVCPMPIGRRHVRRAAPRASVSTALPPRRSMRRNMARASAGRSPTRSPITSRCRRLCGSSFVQDRRDATPCARSSTPAVPKLRVEPAWIADVISRAWRSEDQGETILASTCRLPTHAAAASRPLLCASARLRATACSFV